ncbi:MAG TPA: CAAX prenyl protease-related protein [Verrucomicrobiae bacterium]|nr:CAAX prenyl protease-related protein [Verrucomicrobiae bacterium]
MQSRPWLPYVAPFAIYALFLAAQSAQNRVWVYPLATIVVGAALWVFRRYYEELRSPLWHRSASGSRPAPGPGSTTATWILAVAVGLVAIAIWIGIDPYYPKPENSTMFDPSGKWLFIASRVAGAVIIVPLMEELFWRAFLIRWFIDGDFKRVAVGAFTWSSFAMTVGLFGLEHREWLAGLICGALYNWLYYKRKDVFACVIAHAVSNAALAVWVLARGDWKLW